MPGPRGHAGRTGLRRELRAAAPGAAHAAAAETAIPKGAVGWDGNNLTNKNITIILAPKYDQD